jgi:hypothetical protein
VGDAGTAGVGFYGLDVYSLWESMRVLLSYLGEHEPDALDAAYAKERQPVLVLERATGPADARGADSYSDGSPLEPA